MGALFCLINIFSIVVSEAYFLAQIYTLYVLQKYQEIGFSHPHIFLPDFDLFFLAIFIASFAYFCYLKKNM